jgi:hypothetical protein
MEGLETHLKQEVIPHGIQHLLHSFTVPLYVFLLYSFVYWRSIDNKIPLLRALSAIDEAATDVCNILKKC